MPRIPTRPKAYINYIFFDEQFKTSHGQYGFSAVNSAPGLKDHFSELQNLVAQKSGYVYIYVSNESPVNVFFDNLQVVHTRGPILEETHYYPFGLTMSGISSKALNFGQPENKKKFNNYEFNSDFDINLYESFYRMNDPQLGRFWQIDPKPNEVLSPDSSMGNNPISLNDPLGDTTYYYGPNGQYYGRVLNKGSETVVIVDEKYASQFQGYHDNNFKDFKGRKADDLVKEFGKYGVTYDEAAMEKFSDDNKGKTKIDKVDGTKIDDMGSPITYNGKTISKSSLKKLDAEMLGNLVLKNGVVTVGSGRHSDKDLVSNSPGSLPYEEGKVAHIHNHQTQQPFSIAWSTGGGIIQSSKLISGNPGAGPSSADYSSSTSNTQYRNVVVDQKYVYFITGTQTVKHPR